MKEDITQQECPETSERVGCGLVMKEDITQQNHGYHDKHHSCGLVMKEDITQQHISARITQKVVVW